jgi:hypothetical protein
MHPSTEILLIYLLNKSYKSNLRLNSQLNGKNHHTTFDDFVCDENHFKKINTHPLVYVKLI